MLHIIVRKELYIADKRPEPMIQYIYGKCMVYIGYIQVSELELSMNIYLYYILICVYIGMYTQRIASTAVRP